MHWGRGGWHFIHNICLNCTHRDAIINWLYATVRVLPCPDCCTHAQKYIEDHPPEHAEDLFEWSVHFHNSVNERLGKENVRVEDAALALHTYASGDNAGAVMLGMLAGGALGFASGRYTARAKVECPLSNTQ